MLFGAFDHIKAMIGVHCDLNGIDAAFAERIQNRFKRFGWNTAQNGNNTMLAKLVKDVADHL